jgi:hypothetical protein
LAEYPDPPTTHKISPFQSIRIRLTFCSASHDKTSKEMKPLPSNRIIRWEVTRRRGNIRLFPAAGGNAKIHFGWSNAPFSMRSDTPCPARINPGFGFARFVRRVEAFSVRARHMLERVAHAWSLVELPYSICQQGCFDPRPLFTSA